MVHAKIISTIFFSDDSFKDKQLRKNSNVVLKFCPFYIIQHQFPLTSSLLSGLGTQQGFQLESSQEDMQKGHKGQPWHHMMRVLNPESPPYPGPGQRCSWLGQ